MRFFYSCICNKSVDDEAEGVGRHLKIAYAIFHVSHKAAIATMDLKIAYAILYTSEISGALCPILKIAYAIYNTIHKVFFYVKPLKIAYAMLAEKK